MKNSRNPVIGKVLMLKLEISGIRAVSLDPVAFVECWAMVCGITMAHLDVLECFGVGWRDENFAALQQHMSDSCDSIDSSAQLGP